MEWNRNGSFQIESRSSFLNESFGFEVHGCTPIPWKVAMFTNRATNIEHTDGKKDIHGVFFFADAHCGFAVPQPVSRLLP